MPSVSPLNTQATISVTTGIRSLFSSLSVLLKHLFYNFIVMKPLKVVISVIVVIKDEYYM